MYSYTSGGLVNKKRLTASGAQPLTLNTQQTYDNEGRVTGVTYPDMYQNLNGGVPFVFQAGATYSFSYDTMGRPSGMSDPTVSWVKDIVYGPASELTQIKYRNTASTLSSTDFYTETRTYNIRLQLTRLQDSIPGISNNLDLEYRYSATQNNGQITQQKDWLSGEEVSYTYDNLQRLITAVTTGPEWGQSFSYDGFGNRTGATVTKGTAPSSSFTIDAATNRVINSGFSYDANGNMLAGAGVTSAVYDVENRMVSVTGTGAEQYAYGATNKRIWKKKPNGEEEIYFYGIGGQKLVTYTKTVTYNLWEVQGGTNLYFGSRAIVLRGVTTTSDRLGSRGSYFPYGEEKQVTSQDREKFTSYFRDGTTGLDYARNRYYANTLGRFTSPDPYKASAGPDDPGSWNRYAYVQGDPANRTDSSGLAWRYVDGNCVDLVGYDVFGSTDCPEELPPSVTVTVTDDQPKVPVVEAPLEPLILPVLTSGQGGGDGGGGGTTPVSPATNKTPQQQQKCLDSYNNSLMGKGMMFFSIYNLATDFRNAWKDWTLYPGIKIATAAVTKSLSQTWNIEFWSITSGAAVPASQIVAPAAAAVDTAEAVLGPVAPFAIGGATLIDVGVHLQCSVDPTLPPGGIPIGPK